MSIANIVFTDLVINAEAQDPDNHPDWLCANDPLVFSAACRNTGDRSTRGFHVTFRLDGRDDSVRVDGLSPGEEQWVQWRHDALPQGQHEIFVEFDAHERIRESDENDNSYAHQFEVHAAQPDGHTVDFAAETVVGDPDYEAHGWRLIDVNFIIRDPLGAPIRGYQFFTQFFGPQQEESYGGRDMSDSELDGAGVLRCPDIWLKPEGSVRIMGVATAGGPHGAGPVLEGVQWYRLAEGSEILVFDVVQERTEIEVEARSSREASEKVAAEGHAGITIEILEIGGSVSTEQGTVRTDERLIKYKVVLATPTLTLTQTR